MDSIEQSGSREEGGDDFRWVNPQVILFPPGWCSAPDEIYEGRPYQLVFHLRRAQRDSGQGQEQGEGKRELVHGTAHIA